MVTPNPHELPAKRHRVTAEQDDDMLDIYCPWCTDGLDAPLSDALCGQPGCRPDGNDV